MVRTFAAIDVGSFELELGIYEITDKGNVRTVDQVKHMIALGKDTYNTGKISYRLVEEMCEVLQDFVRIMKEYQVKEYRAYATSAMREARNSQIVLEQLRVRTGIDVKIISNSEQRFISYKAIAAKDAEFRRTSSGVRQLWMWDLEACRPLSLIRMPWFPPRICPSACCACGN